MLSIGFHILCNGVLIGALSPKAIRDCSFLVPEQPVPCHLGLLHHSGTIIHDVAEAANDIPVSEALS
jgi:hypothetical protein